MMSGDVLPKTFPTKNPLRSQEKKKKEAGGGGGGGGREYCEIKFRGTYLLFKIFPSARARIS